MEEVKKLKSNSYKSREVKTSDDEKKKIQKVVNGKVKIKEKTGIQKITDIFVPEDVSSIKSYVVHDIVVPLIRDALFDTFKAFLYPGGGRSTSRGRTTNASYVSYSRNYDRDNHRDSRTYSRDDYTNIVLDDRRDAEEVLVRMDELIDDYGMVSVADLYDIIGMSMVHTDNKYGWTNIRNATVVSVRDGYLLKLPRAVAL